MANNTVQRNINGPRRFGKVDPFAPLSPDLRGLAGTSIAAKRVDSRQPGTGRAPRDGRKLAKGLANQPDSILDGKA
jgi:hypothetical protein